MREITVDGWCHLCPLWDGEWGTCNADPDRRDSRCDDGRHRRLQAPEWCPLRSGGVLVSLREATVKAAPEPEGT